MLMADFNQSLTVAEAIQRGRALDGEGLYWIEEPVRADDFHGCARVAAAVSTPVQIGENFSGAFEMHAALPCEASDFVMIDAQQIGGVTAGSRGQRWLTSTAPRCRAIYSRKPAHICLPSVPRAPGLST